MNLVLLYLNINLLALYGSWCHEHNLISAPSATSQTQRYDDSVKEKPKEEAMHILRATAELFIDRIMSRVNLSPDLLMLSCARVWDKSVAPSPDLASISWTAFLRPDRREAKKPS